MQRCSNWDRMGQVTGRRARLHHASKQVRHLTENERQLRRKYYCVLADGPDQTPRSNNQKLSLTKFEDLAWAFSCNHLRPTQRIGTTVFVILWKFWMLRANPLRGCVSSNLLLYA